MSEHARILGAGVLLFATALIIGVLVITLGSTPYPLDPSEPYVHRVFDGYNCIVYNSTHARCQQCVVYNATANTRNCTTCSATFAKPHVFNNCTSNITNGTIPIASIASGSVPPAPAVGAGAASPSASGPTTTVTSTITVTTTLVGSSTVPVGANAAGSPSVPVPSADSPVAPLVE